MNWVVVTRDAYEAWEASTASDADADADADLRIEVLTWVVALQDAGPPADGIFDPFRETMFTHVGDTGVWIEYWSSHTSSPQRS